MHAFHNVSAVCSSLDIISVANYLHEQPHGNIQNMPKIPTVLYCTLLVSARVLVHLILAAPATPTSPFAFFFHVYDKIHTAVFQKLV